MPTFALRSRRVVTPQGLRPATVLVRDGKIEAVEPFESSAGTFGLLDAAEKLLMPALVDTHVHVNEPGRAEWEGFETATQAAAAGGVSTLVDMPLNSVPVTTSLRALEAKRRSAQGKCWVDCGFWGGVVPGNRGELEAMIDAGVFGFKAFLIDSGIPEFPAVEERDLREAMPVLARRGVPLLAHAELCGPAPIPRNSRRYKDYLDSRPKAWENEAVRMLSRLCRETGCRVHVVHLSSAQALESLREAKAEGLPMSAETCPHYLCLCAEDVGDGRTEFKCAPPIREAANRERLWEALADGTIDFIVSDHSPCLPELKELESGDFQRAWGGISSLQWGLPAVWTEARSRGFSAERMAAWMSAAPAAFAGLRSKGAVEVGKDADLVVWDPDASFTADPRGLKHRHRVSPYAGRKFFGVVETTFLRGEKIYERGNLAGPCGVALRRESAAVHRSA